jgi:hypothetical protein
MTAELSTVADINCARNRIPFVSFLMPALPLLVCAGIAAWVKPARIWPYSHDPNSSLIAEDAGDTLP